MYTCKPLTRKELTPPQDTRQVKGQDKTGQDKYSRTQDSTEQGTGQGTGREYPLGVFWGEVMTDAELPVADLPNRYNVARSQVYSRLDALKQRDPTLVPEKRGKKAYVSGHLLELMDSLHVLISQQGETVSEAVDTVLNIPSQTRPMRPTGQPDRTQDSAIVTTDEMPSELALLASAIAANQPPPDPLARYRQLEEIAANGWQLPTSELAELLGLKTLSGSELERYGFRFVKVGKAGVESAWKVEKLG